MSEIYLVRHGQASYGATDYDQLSELGYQQSRWLGEYFSQRNIHFDRVLRGDMKRHKQTVEAVSDGLRQTFDAEEFSGLNEYDFDQIYKAYQSLTGHDGLGQGDDKRAFYSTLRKSLYCWANGELDENLLPESWASFQARVNAVIQAILGADAGKETILVVSSGGAIATWAQLVLGAPASAAIELNLQLRNSSFSHYFYNGQRIQLSGLNNIPHLDQMDRLDAISYA